MSQPNYESRRNRVRRQFRGAGIDGLIVSGLANVRYLTGFTGDSSWLFLSRGRTVLLSDSRYETQLANECPDLDVEIRDAGATIQDLARTAVTSGDSRHPGFEADHLPWSTAQQLIETVRSGSSVELLPVSGIVEGIREVKDRWELAEIREAVRIAERGFGVMRSSLTSHQTELEVREILERAMKDFGGSGTAFEPIVGVGPTAALPHAHAGRLQVQESSVLLVDWGAARPSGYRSDLTRVLFTGRVTKQMERVYNVVLAAQQAAIAAIQPGARLADVDQIARGMIADAGFGRWFGHGLGHGFGLEIHESLRMSPISDQVFQPGMVITVEPGIYLPGKFGVRIEDDVVVTKDGFELLSSLPREFESSFVEFLA